MSSGKMSLSSFSVSALLALGIVFGDIGTSPLYVLTAMLGTKPKFYTEPHIVGAIGLVCWTLIIVVTAFYCGTVLRISQHGDGGITVLRGKVHRLIDQFWAHVGIAGVIADGQITPAISVLSAWWGLLSVEGYKTLTVAIQEQVVQSGWIPRVGEATLLEVQRAEIGKAIAIVLTIIALIVLAAMQKKGSNKIGTYFGPVMLVWFGMLIWGGLPQIIQHPGIMLAPFRIDCIYSLLTRDIPWWESWVLFGVAILASLAAFGAIWGRAYF